MSSLFESTMEKLKEAIEDRGSIRSMAEILGMNPSTVSRWFAEGRSPDFRGLTKIFEHLGIQIIFPGEEIQKNKRLSPDNTDDKITFLESKNKELNNDLLRKEGAINILKEQLAEAHKALAINENSQKQSVNPQPQAEETEKTA